MTHLDSPAPDNRLFRACDPTDQKVLRALNDASRAHVELRAALMAGDIDQACVQGMAFATTLQALFHETVRLGRLLDAAASAHERELAEAAEARQGAADEVA